MENKSPFGNRLTLRFAGENPDEVLEFGDHVSVRRGSLYTPERVWPGQIVRLEPSTGKIGYARITNVTHDVTFNDLVDDPRVLDYERSAYRTPEALWEVLARLYPGVDQRTLWTVIGFDTYLRSETWLPF